MKAACFLLCAAAAGLLASCTRSTPPNVLVVTFDTTRYDRLGCTGDAKARTPTVDALAQSGVIFDQAFSSAPITLPAHVTMMTGLEAFAHGVHDNGLFQVPDDIPILAEMLGNAGYDTGAFVSTSVLAAEHKLNRGFVVYDDETSAIGGTLNPSTPKRRADETTSAAVDWLRKRPKADSPFFLWIHYYDPHLPYQLTPPFDSMPDEYAAS